MDKNTKIVIIYPNETTPRQGFLSPQAISDNNTLYRN